MTGKLQANSFGWHGQFFQAIAHMAPAAGVVLTMQFMATRGGAAIPLACLFAGVLALLIAYCIGLLTKKYNGASGYFQIHSRALGLKVGFTTSWLFFIYEPFNAFATSIGFGALILEPFSEAYLGFRLPWWIAVIFCNALVVLLALSNIKSSIKVTAILGIVEFLIFVALGAVLILKGEPGFHPEYFTPSSSAEGWNGLAFAFIFGFLAFVGFESGLPLSEETKEPHKTLAKGLLISVAIAGLFYTFISYATVVGFDGGADPATFAKDFGTSPNPYGETLALKAFGVIGPWLIFFAALNSTLACCLASHNAATRVFFSLGRAGVLPRWLGKATAANKVPVNAVLFAAIITALATLVALCVIGEHSAVEWYGFVGVMCVVALLIIHLMTCLSVYIVYKHREGGFQLLRHAVIPIVTSLLILLPLWGSIYYNQSAPMAYAPYVVATWFCIGLLVYTWLRCKKPETLQALESEMERHKPLNSSLLH